MRWSDLQHAQPRLCGRARTMLLEPGVVLVATIRHDGSPRLSAVEPFVQDGGLWLSMLWRSRKVQDLFRDPRILVHSVVTGPNGSAGEVKLRGTARSETDPEVQARYAVAVGDALGWHPVPGRFHLFEVDIDEVADLRYDDATGDQFVARWPPPREYVRRATTATSLGRREPVHDLVD